MLTPEGTGAVGTPGASGARTEVTAGILRRLDSGITFGPAVALALARRRYVRVDGRHWEQNCDFQIVHILIELVSGICCF